MKDQLQKAHPLLFDRTRLMIMTLLCSSGEQLGFSEIISNLSLSKGNLSSHMLKLEKANLVGIQKEFIGRKPYTSYFPTDLGRAAILQYFEAVESTLTKLKGPKA